MPLYIVRQDITKIECDAIVKPSKAKYFKNKRKYNSIKKKGCKQFVQSCKEVGGVKVSSALNMPFNYLIDVAVPSTRVKIFKREQRPDLFYLKSLQIAEKIGCKSVAIPFVPSESSANVSMKWDVAVDNIKKFLDTSDISVYLVVHEGNPSPKISDELLKEVSRCIDEQEFPALRKSFPPEINEIISFISDIRSFISDKSYKDDQDISLLNRVDAIERILLSYESNVFGWDNFSLFRLECEYQLIREEFDRIIQRQYIERYSDIRECRRACTHPVISERSEKHQTSVFGASEAEKQSSLEEALDRVRDSGDSQRIEGIEDLKRQKELERQKEELARGKAKEASSRRERAKVRDNSVARKPRIMYNMDPPAHLKRKAEEYARGKAETGRRSDTEQNKELAKMIEKMDDTFSVTLLKLIDEKGMTEVECYKRANVSKQTWYKIINDGTYRPNKRTMLSFAVALKLTMEETDKFLKTMGFTLSNSIKFDVIISYFINKGKYDIIEINETLYEFDQELLCV